LKRTVIALVGVDGVGKTTHTSMLFNKLNKYGFNSSVIHDEIPTLIAQIMQRSPKPFKSKNYVLGNSSKNAYHTLRGLLHIFLYTFNELVLLLTIIKYFKKSNIVILDRWFIDSLASIAYARIQHLQIIRGIIFTLSRITGIMTKLLRVQALIILLKTDPLIAHIRRPEHSLSRQKLVSVLINYFATITAKRNRWYLIALDTTNKDIKEVHFMMLKAFHGSFVRKFCLNDVLRS